MVQIATEAAPGGGEETAFVFDPLAPSEAYRRDLAALLCSFLLPERDGGAPLPVGFAFATDATKIARWLLAAEGGGRRGENGGAGEVQPASDGELCVGGQLDGSEAELAGRIRAAVVDVQLLAEAGGLGGRTLGFAGLKSTALHWLGQVMSKDEQQSEWEARPLRPEQISYAALDASMCLRVLSAMEDDHGAERLRLLHPRLVWLERERGHRAS